jgi:vitamin B12 transporter
MGKKGLYILSIAAALSCTAFETVFAQQHDLDSITVTASLQPVSAFTTGRNITVLTSESIAKFPVNSLDELLRYVPGIEVQARGPMGSQSDIVLRGGTFQQVLVVLDGIRLNDPNIQQLYPGCYFRN